MQIYASQKASFAARGISPPASSLLHGVKIQDAHGNSYSFHSKSSIAAMAWDLCLHRITRNNLECPQLACFADPTQTLGPLPIAWCLNVQTGSENSSTHNWADAGWWTNLSFHTGYCRPRQTLGQSWLVKVWIQAMKSMLDLEPSFSHPEWTKRWGHHGAWSQAPALALMALNEPGPASLSAHIPCHSLLVTPLASFPLETPSCPLTQVFSARLSSCLAPGWFCLML